MTAAPSGSTLYGLFSLSHWIIWEIHVLLFMIIHLFSPLLHSSATNCNFFSIDLWVFAMRSDKRHLHDEGQSAHSAEVYIAVPVVLFLLGKLTESSFLS